MKMPFFFVVSMVKYELTCVILEGKNVLKNVQLKKLGIKNKQQIQLCQSMEHL